MHDRFVYLLFLLMYVCMYVCMYVGEYIAGPASEDAGVRQATERE